MSLLDYIGDIGLIAADQIVDNNPVSMMINQARGKPEGFIKASEWGSTGMTDVWENKISPSIVQPITKTATGMALNALMPGSGAIYGAADSATGQVGKVVQNTANESVELNKARHDRVMAGKLSAQVGLFLPGQMNNIFSDRFFENAYVNNQFSSSFPMEPYDPKASEILPTGGLSSEAKAEKKKNFYGYEADMNKLGNQYAGTLVGAALMNAGIIAAFSRNQYNPRTGYTPIEEPSPLVPMSALRAQEANTIDRIFNSAVNDARQRNQPINLASVLEAENMLSAKVSEEVLRIMRESQMLKAQVQEKNAMLQANRNQEINAAIMENDRRKAEVYNSLAQTVTGTASNILQTKLNIAAGNRDAYLKMT